MRIRVWLFGLALLLGGYAVLLQVARSWAAPVALASEERSPQATSTLSSSLQTERNPLPALTIGPVAPRPDGESIGSPSSGNFTQPRTSDFGDETMLQPAGAALHIRVAAPGSVKVGESIGVEERTGSVRLALLVGGAALVGGVALLRRRT